MLQAMVEKPEQRIAELSLLTPAEQQTVLVDWNETATQYPRKYVPEFVRGAARAHRMRIAVRYEGKNLSYSELNAAANRIANALSKREVGIKSLVVVCVLIDQPKWLPRCWEC